jgi:hypothetical protein
VLAVALIALPTRPARASLKVDLNPDGDRRDVLTADAENWRFAEAPSATKTFGPITVTIRQSGPVGSALAANWWKGGYDTHATLASDGVFVKGGDGGGQIELIVRGLAPGHHSIVTWHNSIWDAPVSRFSVLMNGKPVLRAIQPSKKVTDDDDATSAYVEFDAEANKDVVLTFKPEGTARINNIILNAFAIDVPNPAKLALKPSPDDGDEHALESPVLTWTASTKATSHQVYLGSSKEAVESATPASSEFKGDVAKSEFATKDLKLNTFDTYFWRVDEVSGKGDDATVTKGEVWSFRVRHVAFPGAEGYGRFAIGGRGGRVIEVTNLDNSGPGSLREAVEAEGPRTIVFRVGGTIHLKTRLIVTKPYCTIAGQTAPGDGIALRGATVGAGGTHDVIIRYVRIRIGDESGRTMDGCGLGYCDNGIVDHCSIAWSIDEGFSSRGAKNITLQRSIIAEPLNLSIHSHYVGTGKGHSFAGSISGEIGSFHHNLLANCAGRNWSLAGGLTRGGMFAGFLDIRNNVVYNWVHRTNDGGVRKLNLVGNYYIPGPATQVFHLLIAKIELRLPNDVQQFFAANNMMEGRPQYDRDNLQNGGVIGPDIAEMKLNEPFCDSFITEQPAKQAYESVIGDVGANYPKYDSIDARTVRDVVRRSFTFRGSKTNLPGIIDSQRDVGPYPDLKGGEAPIDADHDGMPDAWEKDHGLNPNDPADGAIDPVGDGYTNLERYLNTITADRGHASTNEGR